MFRKYLKFSLLFLVLFLVQLFANSSAFSSVAAYTRPLITGAFALMFILSTRLRGRFHRRLFFGLVTLLVADISGLFLDSGSETLFRGIFWSIVSCVFFISAFYLDFRSAPELDKKVARVAILVTLILSFSIYLYLRPHLGVYRIPVLVYTFILSLMAMMAAFRRLRVNRQSFMLILCGTGVFALSDVLLAVNKFVFPFDAARYVVGGAHVLAIYLIVMGGMERVLMRNASPI